MKMPFGKKRDYTLQIINENETLIISGNENLINLNNGDKVKITLKKMTKTTEN